MPKRIQRKRTKGWKMPAGAVYVGRPGYFGNPFTGPLAANAFRRWMTNKMGPAEFMRRRHNPWALHSDKYNIRREMSRLLGKDLACFCPLDQPCHADVLLELANATPATAANTPDQSET